MTPQPELVSAIYGLYKQRNDARLLVPVIAGLSRTDIQKLLPEIVSLPATAVKVCSGVQFLHLKSLFDFSYICYCSFYE